jgi:pyruvate kinase
VIQRIRRIALEFNFPYKILMDLGGPKVRVAAPEKMAVQTNQIVTLVLEKPKKKNQIQCDNPLVFLTVEYFTGHTQGQIYILPHSPQTIRKRISFG